MNQKLFETYLRPTLTMHLWLLLLRVGVGSFMLTHGIPKFNQLMDGNFEFGDPLGVGVHTSFILTVFAEFLCSVLIIVGLGTRVAAVFLSVTMMVAAFIAHGDDPFGKKELALLYLLIYLTLLVFGSGKFSLDRLMVKRDHRRLWK